MSCVDTAHSMACRAKLQFAVLMEAGSAGAQSTSFCSFIPFGISFIERFVDGESSICFSKLTITDDVRILQLTQVNRRWVDTADDACFAHHSPLQGRTTLNMSVLCRLGKTQAGRGAHRGQDEDGVRAAGPAGRRAHAVQGPHHGSRRRARPRHGGQGGTVQLDHVQHLRTAQHCRLEPTFASTFVNKKLGPDKHVCMV